MSLLKITIIITVAIISCSSYSALIYETGSLADEIKLQKHLVFKKHTEQFDEFTKDSPEDILIMSDFFNAGVKIRSLQYLSKIAANFKMDEIAAILDKSNYDFVVFRDTLNNSTFYVLREKINRQTHGWGTYIYNPNYVYDALIECPHPIFDKGSWFIGMKIFLRSNTKAFLLSGAHRFTNQKKKGNLYGSSDTAHIKRSVFQIMHIAWCNPQTSTYQIHGFSSKKYKKIFPETTDVVLSSGKGEITKEVFILNKYLKKLSLKNTTPINSHVANGYNQFTYHNITVNRNSLLSINKSGMVSDSKAFRTLAATDNRQGKYSVHHTKSPFIHIELSSHLRFLESIRPDIAEIIVGAIVETIKMTAYRR
jgi:hypothetical protein